MMRLFALPLALGLCLAVAQPVCATEPKLETDDDKILYSLGFALSQSVGAFQFNEAELAIVQAGMADAVLKRDPKIQLETYGPQIDAYLQQRRTEIAGKEKEAGKAFQAKMAEEPGAVTLESGLIYREIAAGVGASPGATDTVKIDYHGTLRDGTVFDSSIDKATPAPATFALNRVVPVSARGSADEGRGKAKLTCPPESLTRLKRSTDS